MNWMYVLEIVSMILVIIYSFVFYFKFQKRTKEAIETYKRMRYLKYMIRCNNEFLKPESFYKMVNGRTNLAKESDVIPGIAYFKNYSYFN